MVILRTRRRFAISTQERALTLEDSLREALALTMVGIYYRDSQEMPV